jgi:hypothetical protein
VWFVSSSLTIKTFVREDIHGRTFAYSREDPSIYVGYNGKGEEKDARRKVRKLLLERRVHPYSSVKVNVNTHMESTRTQPPPKETNSILVRSRLFNPFFKDSN